MLLHHMQLGNINMCFVMETWTQHGNEPEHQYIMVNLDTAEYKILIQTEKTEKEEELQQYTSHTYMLRSYPSKNIHLLKYW